MNEISIMGITFETSCIIKSVKLKTPFSRLWFWEVLWDLNGSLQTCLMSRLTAFRKMERYQPRPDRLEYNLLDAGDGVEGLLWGTCLIRADEWREGSNNRKSENRRWNEKPLELLNIIEMGEKKWAVSYIEVSFFLYDLIFKCNKD